MQEFLNIDRKEPESSAIAFTGEFEAMYFSNLRKNLKSDMAYMVMNQNQCLDELRLLKQMKGEC